MATTDAQQTTLKKRREGFMHARYVYMHLARPRGRENDQAKGGGAKGPSLQVRLRGHAQDAAGQALCMQPRHWEPAPGEAATECFGRGGGGEGSGKNGVSSFSGFYITCK